MATKIERQIYKLVRDEIRRIQRNLLKTDLKPLGKSIIREMKNLIGKGISPIRGVGRFPEYKDSYQVRIRGQKGEFIGKRNRPVNLKLTGEQLKNLKFRDRREVRFPFLEIGYFDKESIAKEKGHREGANRQRKRPTIPNDNREQFAVRIQRIIESEVDKIAEKLSK